MKTLLAAAVTMAFFLIVGVFNPCFSMDREPGLYLAQQSEEESAKAGEDVDEDDEYDDEYDDEDLRQRIISVETSRGCPFGCEFCLSSREKSVREFPLDDLLTELDRLIARGCRGFKFIDRTFNLDRTRPLRLLEFFHEHDIVFVDDRDGPVTQEGV